MALPDEPLFTLIPAVQLKLGEDVLVAGERPADVDAHLPAVVMSRRGGTALRSTQGVLGDAPLIFADVYATGMAAAYRQMRNLRQAMADLGATENTGPVPTPDEFEPAGVRRLTASWRYATH